MSFMGWVMHAWGQWEGMGNETFMVVEFWFCKMKSSKEFYEYELNPHDNPVR